MIVKIQKYWITEDEIEVPDDLNPHQIADHCREFANGNPAWESTVIFDDKDVEIFNSN
jgi:hypothetical protein